MTQERKRLVVGLCDDEEYVQYDVSKMLKSYGQARKLDIQFIYYHSARLLLEKKDALDVLLLDIEMPEMDGIEAGMKLSDWNINYKIIMLTAREDRFRDAFKIGAFRFVSKPLNETDFYHAIDDVLEVMSVGSNVTIYRNNIAYEIPQKEIVYIEANRSSSLIYTCDHEYRSELSLKKWINLLDKKIFFQCHKSYIVNMSKIEKIKDHIIYLISGDHILLSRRLKTAFFNAYMLYDTRWR